MKTTTFSPSVWAVAVCATSFNFAYHFSPLFSLLALFVYGFIFGQFAKAFVAATRAGGLLGTSLGFLFVIYPLFELNTSKTELVPLLISILALACFFGRGIYNFGVIVGKNLEVAKRP